MSILFATFPIPHTEKLEWLQVISLPVSECSGLAWSSRVSWQPGLVLPQPGAGQAADTGDTSLGMGTKHQPSSGVCYLSVQATDDWYTLGTWRGCSLLGPEWGVAGCDPSSRQSWWVRCYAPHPFFAKKCSDYWQWLFWTKGTRAISLSPTKVAVAAVVSSQAVKTPHHPWASPMLLHPVYPEACLQIALVWVFFTDFR